jgi:hypothetical protein
MVAQFLIKQTPQSDIKRVTWKVVHGENWPYPSLVIRSIYIIKVNKLEKTKIETIKRIATLNHVQLQNKYNSKNNKNSKLVKKIVECKKKKIWGVTASAAQDLLI